MAEGGELQGLSARVGVVEENITTIKSTLDRMTQEIDKLSLKIDDRSLADRTHRNGYDRQSNQLPPQQPPPQPPPLQRPPPQQPPLYHRQPQQPPPPRHPIWNFQNEDLYDEEELNTFNQEDDFGDEAYDEGMAYKRGHKRMANPT